MPSPLKWIDKRAGTHLSKRFDKRFRGYNAISSHTQEVAEESLGFIKSGYNAFSNVSQVRVAVPFYKRAVRFFKSDSMVRFETSKFGSDALFDSKTSKFFNFVDSEIHNCKITREDANKMHGNYAISFIDNNGKFHENLKMRPISQDGHDLNNDRYALYAIADSHHISGYDRERTSTVLLDKYTGQIVPYSTVDISMMVHNQMVDCYSSTIIGKGNQRNWPLSLLAVIVLFVPKLSHMIMCVFRSITDTISEKILSYLNDANDSKQSAKDMMTQARPGNWLANKMLGDPRSSIISKILLFPFRLIVLPFRTCSSVFAWIGKLIMKSPAKVFIKVPLVLLSTLLEFTGRLGTSITSSSLVIFNTPIKVMGALEFDKHDQSIQSAKHGLSTTGRSWKESFSVLKEGSHNLKVALGIQHGAFKHEVCSGEQLERDSVGSQASVSEELVVTKKDSAYNHVEPERRILASVHSDGRSAEDIRRTAVLSFAGAQIFIPQQPPHRTQAPRNSRNIWSSLTTMFRKSKSGALETGEDLSRKDRSTNATETRHSASAQENPLYLSPITHHTNPTYQGARADIGRDW